jgi:hypothetical protein
MYSLVLVAALSSGADVDPAPVGVPVVLGVGCGSVPAGCSGYPGVAYGCSGSGYGSSSYAASCYGSMFGHGSGAGVFGLRAPLPVPRRQHGELQLLRWRRQLLRLRRLGLPGQQLRRR